VTLVSFLGITLLTGIVSGSYPALYLSGFEPAAVMKGLIKSSVGELWARKGLVVLQFFLSVILIASVLVIYKQVGFVETKNLGYKKDHLIQFHIEGAVSKNTEAFLNEVNRIPGVISAAAIGHDLLGRQNNTSELRWEGKNPNDLILFENVSASYGLLETLGVKIVEGRLFSEEFPADTTRIILNETGIRVMNLKNPIGKTVNLGDTQKLEIIGVVKDFHFESLHEIINPLFFRLSPRNTWNIMVRLEAGKEKATLEALSRFYTRFNPGFTFEYQFQDREYAQRYASEQRMATLSGYFACFAIVISCLGLFGLAAFTAERRQKEIGIRKLLGSSSTGIILLVSGDFTRLVVLSILLGWPVSYWLLDKWLERFAFHIDLTAWYFAAAGLIALLIALLTVVFQAIRASLVNPINSLRSE
jgi:hypothetical protein